MTIVQAVKGIAAWINEKVCPRISFKKASDTVQDAGYAAKEAHPRAYPMFYPGKDKLPAGEDWAEPFILVTPIKGVRNALQGRQTLTVQLTFRTWNPGTHGQELGEENSFQPNIEGWQDVENLLDWTLREIENEEYINGLHFVASSDTEYGLLVKDGQYIDEYPYFSAYATVIFEWSIARTSSAYADML